MNVVFVGGGSFRTLPIVRGILQNPKVIGGGEIRLVDFNLTRVETVGKLIMRTPEFAKAGCKVSWTDKLEEALPGADVVSISFPVGSYKTCKLSEQACARHGLFGSDQLSVSGAFRAVTGGTVVLDIARQMEKHCPKAWLFDYANPVAVYSGMVNNHTKIRALGICGGFTNHRWDLGRLIFGRDEYCGEFTDVACAGVNHCSILLRGKVHGRDIYELIDEAIGVPGWEPCRITKMPKGEGYIRRQLVLLTEMRRRFGYVVFSTEGDGFAHICPELWQEPAGGPAPEQTVAQIEEAARKGAADRAAIDQEFREHLSRELTPEFWAQDSLANPRFAANPDDAACVVLRGLSGQSREWLAASLPNRRAVKGFKDRVVLEYSFTLDKDGVHPDADLEVPDCFHGLMTSLSMHQTLLGDAIATRDPRLFAQALYAYPLHQNERPTRALWKELLAIHRQEMPEVFQKTGDYC
jgi:alpha-galactosidase/6-phospho-beta-glucosidase family protein